MPESFGGRLRQERERQQIALTTIAEQTKIKLSLLEALERDDVSHWPTGIFRRAFIRSYAHAIGLEPDGVVRDFLARYPDVDDVGAIASTALPVGGDADSRLRPPTRLHYLVGRAIGSLSSHIAHEHTDAGPVGVQQPSTQREDTATPREDAAAPPLPAVSNGRSAEPNLAEAANLCTELGRARGFDDAAPLLPRAAAMLDAAGLIVWVWDSQAGGLKPTLAHGYPNAMLARLPSVGRDADNATAAAFRTAQPCVVTGDATASGAVVVPLMAAAGCVGVLAFEMRHGGEQRASVRAVAAMFAVPLAKLVETLHLDEVTGRKLA
jgi:hypothetical protein